MKKYFGLLLTIVLLLACAAAAAADAPLDTDHFPDDAFRKYVAQFDYSGDGILQDDEIATVEGMDCSNLGITSLEGIRYFTGLVGIECSNNKITKVDFSQNKHLAIVSIYSNQLKELTVSNNSNLVELRCSNNQLTSVKLPNSKNMHILDTSGNNIKTLDISKAPILIDLVKKVKPTDYIYWDGGYAINWVIDTPEK